MILLTPEEKLIILKQCRHNGETLIPKLLDEITKAQLKKFIQWGSEYCELKNRPRRECEHCWQALLEETK